MYVLLKSSSLIPKESRSHGPSIIQHLSKLNKWDGRWKTLTLSKEGLQLDNFPPHSLSKELVPEGYRLYDLFSLQDMEQIKHRTWRFRKSETQCYLKLARFAFEIETLEQETRAYLFLESLRSILTPKLLGFAYEETKDRLIGIVIQSVEGRRPTPADLEICREAVEQLHQQGIIHGDINNHNIIICADGVKFIDLEDSYVRSTEHDKSWTRRRVQEMRTLELRLLSESDVGRPW